MKIEQRIAKGCVGTAVAAVLLIKPGCIAHRVEFSFVTERTSPPPPLQDDHINSSARHQPGMTRRMAGVSVVPSVGTSSAVVEAEQ